MTDALQVIYLLTLLPTYYPHMPIGTVWIYCLLFVRFFCNFVCLYNYGFLSQR